MLYAVYQWTEREKRLKAGVKSGQMTEKGEPTIPTDYENKKPGENRNTRLGDIKKITIRQGK
jgi:hypothetical protein